MSSNYRISPRVGSVPVVSPRFFSSVSPGNHNNGSNGSNTFLLPSPQGNHTKIIYQSNLRWKLLSLLFLSLFILQTFYTSKSPSTENSNFVSSSSSTSSAFYQHLKHNPLNDGESKRVLTNNQPKNSLTNPKTMNTKDRKGIITSSSSTSSSSAVSSFPSSSTSLVHSSSEEQQQQYPPSVHPHNNNNDEGIGVPHHSIPDNQDTSNTDASLHHLRGRDGNERTETRSGSGTSSDLSVPSLPSNVSTLSTATDASSLPCCVGDGPRKVCWNRSPLGRPYRILFHSNQLGLRGTEIGLYEYARYFEELACGKAYIATNYGSPYLETLPKFEKRFGPVYYIPKPPDTGRRGSKRRVRPSARPRPVYDSAVAEAAARAAAAAAEAAARQIQTMMNNNRVNQIYGGTTTDNAVLYRRPGRTLLDTTESRSNTTLTEPGSVPISSLSPSGTDATGPLPPTVALPSVSPSAPPVTMRYDLQNSVLKNITTTLGIDAIFTIQPDTIPPIFIRPQPGIKLLIQGVFSGTGNFANLADAAVVVGETVPRKENVNVVSRIVNFDFPEESIVSLRNELGIPEDAQVFCRHGDIKTFNIAAARDTVCRFARTHPHRYFVFMNTEPLVCKVDNIIYLPASYDTQYKQRFLATCNACIHGRADGETFGMAIAECSLAGLPVFTHRSMGASNHLLLLGDHAIKYNDSTTFFNALARFNPYEAKAKRDTYKKLYQRFSPGNVMLDFLSYFGILTDVISVSTTGKPISPITVSSVSNALMSPSSTPATPAK